jgi:hypothetical protein
VEKQCQSARFIPPLFPSSLAHRTFPHHGNPDHLRHHCVSALAQTGRYFLLDPYEIVWMIACDLIVFGCLAKAFLWPLRGKKKDIVESGKRRQNCKASY